MHSITRMRDCMLPSYLSLLVSLQVAFLIQMNQVSAFSSCHRLRPLTGTFVPQVLNSFTRCPSRFRAGDRFFRMGPLPADDPGEPDLKGFRKIIQRLFSRGGGSDGDNGRRRFIRFGVALAAPLLALETWKSLDPTALSRRSVLAQPAIVESIASSDSKLAPNEVNTIRYSCPPCYNANSPFGLHHSQHNSFLAAVSSGTTSHPSSSSTPSSPRRTSSP